MHLLGLIVFALTAQHLGKIIHARQRRWMLLTQHPLRQRQCLSKHLFGLFIFALTA